MSRAIYVPADPANLNKILKNYTTKDLYNHYAILIGGGTEERHRNNISMAYQVLIEQGYKRKNIFIFDSEGGEPPIFPITDQTSNKSFLIIMKWMSKHVSQNDTMLIYMTGHGTKTQDGSAFVLNKAQKVSKQMFEEMLEHINPKIGIIITDFCYWGPILNNKLNNYIFISATDDNRVSHGTTFGRTFWKYFRENDDINIMDAFFYAYKNDPFSRQRKNNPSITYTNINPKLFDLLGEKKVLR